MRQDKFSKAHLILYACGIIPVVWLALLLAPIWAADWRDWCGTAGAALDHPFHIVWCEGSLKTVLIFLLCYALGDWRLPLHRPQLPQAGGTRLRQMGRSKRNQQEICGQGADREQNSHTKCRHWAGWPQTPAQSECPGGGRQRRGQDQVLRQTQHYERQHQPDRTGLQR